MVLLIGSAVLGGAAALACDDSDAVNPVDGGPPAIGTADVLVPGDASDSGAEAAPVLTGTIALFNVSATVDGAVDEGFFAAAQFTRTTGEDATSFTHRTAGACDVAISSRTKGRGLDIQRVSAGPVHVTGGSTPLSLSDEGGAYGIAVSDASTLWSGGETLAVSAAGGVAPAFDLSMKAPAQIVLTAPVLTGTPPLIARGADMSVTWTGGTAGTLLVIGLHATGLDHAYIIECTFDAAAGNGSIPAAALTDTPAGDGILTAYGRSKSAITSDGWSISAMASALVLNANGAYINGHVTFQ